MEPLKSINKEIERLEKLINTSPDVHLIDALSSLRRLRICAFILSRDRINLRELIRSITVGRQKEVAESVGVRPATISDYLSYKSAMSADSIENILNYTEQV